MLQEQLGKQDQPQQQSEQQFRTPVAESVDNFEVGSTPISLREERNSAASPYSVRPSVTHATTNNSQDSSFHVTRPSHATLATLSVDQVGRHKIADCFAL